MHNCHVLKYPFPSFMRSKLLIQLKSIIINFLIKYSFPHSASKLILKHLHEKREVNCFISLFVPLFKSENGLLYKIKFDVKITRNYGCLKADDQVKIFSWEKDSVDRYTATLFFYSYNVGSRSIIIIY